MWDLVGGLVDREGRLDLFRGRRGNFWRGDVGCRIF